MGPTKVLRFLVQRVGAVTGHTAIHGGFPHSHIIPCVSIPAMSGIRNF